MELRPFTKAVILILPAALAACSTERESFPARTATEQLLISKAADNASDALKLGLPKGTRAFVDETHFEGTDSKYALAAIRASLLRQGVDIVDDKAKAQAIIDLRSGALSINQRNLVIGLPSFTVPIPLAGPFTTPELALYGSNSSRGIAKFGAISYDASSGALRGTSGPVYGYSEKVKHTLLFFISWTKQDILPDSGGLGLAPAPTQTDAASPWTSSTTSAPQSYRLPL